MEGQQIPTDFTTETLTKKVVFLEAALAIKDAVISEKDVVISEKDVVISDTSADLLRLSAELEAEKFKYAQLQRMIFGSKRERFISSNFPEQLKLELEPKSAEIEQVVEAERETIRIAYERKKVKKKAHPGRLALPSHLPVVETILEPTEDTIGMVCIGQEVTDELDYTPAELLINRTIRPKYITKEDELGNQKQVIAQLNRPINKCIASAALLSMIFTYKFIYHLPYISHSAAHKPAGSHNTYKYIRVVGQTWRPTHQTTLCCSSPVCF
jgi:transposase